MPILLGGSKRRRVEEFLIIDGNINDAKGALIHNRRRKKCPALEDVFHKGVFLFKYWIFLAPGLEGASLEDIHGKGFSEVLLRVACPIA